MKKRIYLKNVYCIHCNLKNEKLNRKGGYKDFFYDVYTLKVVADFTQKTLITVLFFSKKNEAQNEVK